MRYTLIAAAAVVAAVASFAVGSSPAKAQDWPWCADYSGGSKGGGGTNCGFASWEQCQVNIRGIGGWCYPNPYFRAEVRPPRRHRRHRRQD